jgi:hypothetical protein
LRELINRGQLTADTYVYNDSPEDAPKGWQRAGDTEIAALFLNNSQGTQTLLPIQNQGTTSVSPEAPEETVRCPSCGANNVIVSGGITECEYCGTPLLSIQNQETTCVSSEATGENAENSCHSLSDEGEAQTFSSNNAYEPGRRQFEEETKSEKLSVNSIIVNIVEILSSKKQIAGIIGSACAALILALLLAWRSQQSPAPTSQNITNENKTAQNKTTEIPKKTDANAILALVDVRVVPTLDGSICAFITNNSDVVIDELEVQVQYLDSSKNIVDVDSDGHDMVLPGYIVVSRLDCPQEYTDIRIKKTIELGAHSRYENHSEKISVSTNQGVGSIIIQITNNSDISIDEVEYVVVYYKGSNVASVSYPQDIHDVSAGETITKKESYYGVDADSYRVFINQAHTFW